MPPGPERTGWTSASVRRAPSGPVPTTVPGAVRSVVAAVQPCAAAASRTTRTPCPLSVSRRTSSHALYAAIPPATAAALFGLWHVVPSLGGGTANATMASVVGADAAGTLVRVVVTVVFTSLAGVVLCCLRLRSGSLLAPVLAHWTVNGLGVIVTLVA